MAKHNEADDPALGPGRCSAISICGRWRRRSCTSRCWCDGGRGDGDVEDRETLKQRWLEQFNTAFGTDDNASRRRLMGRFRKDADADERAAR